MKRTGKTVGFAMLAFASLFILLSMGLAPSDPVTVDWAKTNLVNSRRGANIPIWKFTKDCMRSVDVWKDWPNCKRFAVYDVLNNNSGQVHDYVDDVVLDKETGLVWPRDGNITSGPRSWQDAINFLRNMSLGERKGWRLPTAEELSTLVSLNTFAPTLPPGHPFVFIQHDVNDPPYWTHTTYESRTGPDLRGLRAWTVSMRDGQLDHLEKDELCFVMPVRGGNAPASAEWAY